MQLEKAGEIGFCFGVRRAIEIVGKLAGERGSVETLGALVHNRQVVQELAKLGVNIAQGVSEIRGNRVVVSAHGISPEIEAELGSRHIEIIDTTCPFVRRLQRAAGKLAEAGFFVVIYGDSDHPEVKATLGWASNQGVASLDGKFITGLPGLPRRIGILSQTTRAPSRFLDFTKSIVDAAFTRDSEFRVIDTICHDIRQRQTAALELANRVDLMLVIGDPSSANTNQLVELCATVAITMLVETAADIRPVWLEGRDRIGITSGASTSERTINEVMARLEKMAGK